MRRLLSILTLTIALLISNSVFSQPAEAILVTENLKQLNPEFFINENIGDVAVKRVPNRFNGTENVLGGYRLRGDLQDIDGWKDIFIPPYNSQTQKLGALILDSIYYTYQVLDLTEAEINGRIVSQTENDKQQLIQAKLELQVVEDAQSASDEDALEQISLYPFWQDLVGQFIETPFLCLNIVDSELRLYRLEQSHAFEFEPQEVPALFTRVQLDEVLNWVQPTGAQDAYNIGDQVVYPSDSGQIWTSQVDANVFAPGVVVGQWILN